jgi:5'-nucleotidase
MEENFLIEVQREKILELNVLPVNSTLQTYVDILRDTSDLIVVLLHGNFQKGVQLAKNIQGIDIMLVASDDGRFEIVDDTLVQSTYGHQKSLGYLKTKVEDGQIVEHEARQIWLWADVPLRPSSQIVDLITEVDKTIGSKYGEVIGRSVQDHFRTANSVERSLGNWITDAMRWKSGAQVSLHNTGGIRSDVLEGPIAIEDVYRVFPFRNTLVVFQLTGQQIKDLIEHDIQRGWDRLQVSGLRYTYYPKQAKPLGKRVSSLVVNGKNIMRDGKILCPETTYTVVSNSYLIGQAEDKYFGFPVKEFKETDWLIYQILIDWLKEHKVLDYHVEGRILKVKE